MKYSKLCNSIFQESINHYHLRKTIRQKIQNPYQKGTLKAILCEKNWIDTIQWHLEDEVRTPGISSLIGLKIKYEIDRSNQARTDLVEKIDQYFYQKFKKVALQPNARKNTETPAWAIDRLSILNLKIYHMQQECYRPHIKPEYKEMRASRYEILLLNQLNDLSEALDDLFCQIQAGQIQITTYRQIKMYNDSEMNPKLRKAK